MIGFSFDKFLWSAIETFWYATQKYSYYSYEQFQTRLWNEYFFHSTPQRSRTIRGQKRSLWMQNRFVTDLFVCGAWYSNTLLATWHKWHALCLRPIALEYPADITVLLHITSLLIKFSNRIISRRIINSRDLQQYLKYLIVLKVDS